jgi:1,5-anhydro-D-fructose reductase (1,5-anhydro-D-mannitol-forming)
MTLKIGVVGFGRMGQTRAQAVEDSGLGKVVAIYDPALPCPVPFPVVGSIEEIIADRAIDAVFLCLPNFLNKPTTIAALQAGKHVFCEKPPCFTAADMREIMAVEEMAERVLMYGFNHRQHESILKMKEVIEEGRHGRVLWMRGRYGKSVDADYLKTWRAKKELAGGGILLDQGIHMLDLFLYLAGRPFDEVHAFVSNLYWKTPGIEDNVFAMFRDSATGLAVSFHSTMTQWRHLFSLEVFLERGYMVLNGLNTSSKSYGEEVLTIAKNRSTAPAATWETEERLKYTYDTSWSREVSLFINAILGHRPVRYGSSAQALQVMELIDRIYTNQRHEAADLRSELVTVED